MYKVHFNKDRTILFLVFASEHEAEQYFSKHSLEDAATSPAMVVS